MKRALFGLGILLAGLASAAPPSSDLNATPLGDFKAADATLISGWGAPVDQDGDCKFRVVVRGLKITVPGSERPHDLAAENDMLNAPRVMQKVRGDFTIQVRVDGTFEPGEESTQPGRTGYTGAGLVVFADEKNYVTLARAALQAQGIERAGYVNFEMRVDARNTRFGTTGDRPIKKEEPLYLRLEKKGNKFYAAVSEDGVTWEDMGSKDIPEGWPEQMDAGVAVVSTSKEPFQPTFGSLHIKSAEAKSAEAEASETAPAKPAEPPAEKETK